MKKITLVEVILILGLLTALGFLVRSFIQKIKDKKDLEAGLELSKNKALTGDAATVIKNIPPSKIAQAKKIMDSWNPIPVGDMIKAAKGTFWGGDANAVYRAFGMIDTKPELALLSTYFEGLYGTPLLSFLSWMSPAEMANLNNIIKTLDDI